MTLIWKLLVTNTSCHIFPYQRLKWASSWDLEFLVLHNMDASSHNLHIMKHSAFWWRGSRCPERSIACTSSTIALSDQSSWQVIRVILIHRRVRLFLWYRTMWILDFENKMLTTTCNNNDSVTGSDILSLTGVKIGNIGFKFSNVFVF